MVARCGPLARGPEPIIHVRHDSVQAGSSLAPGQWGNDFRDGFEPQGDEPVVSKSVNSAFIGTDLDLRLRRLGAERIVTFGISTDMCVSTTIRTGANMGWKFVLAADACDCFALPDGKRNDPAMAIRPIMSRRCDGVCEVVTTAS